MLTPGQAHDLAGAEPLVPVEQFREMRAAVTAFSKCCATTVSTVGTPVMSMMATRELV